MSNTAYVRLYYQSHEEVLETGVWYVNTTGGAPINPTVHQELSREVRDAVNANWIALMAKDTVAWAVAVEVPKQDDGINGPYRFISSLALESTSLVEALPDSVIQRATFVGTSTLDDPVRGGLRLSGVKKSVVDCNVIDNAHLITLKDFVDAVFKAQWTLSGGEDFIRVVKHKKAGSPVQFVPVPTVEYPPRVTTRIDRVLNRTQCRPDTVAGPA